MNHFIKITNCLKGYRTFAVNILLTIMPILEMSEILDVLPKGYEAKYAIMIALVNLYLRTITTTPLGKS
ncbi:MAG: hypothetical protein ABJE63_10010 [Lentilitoribacter sp.]